MANMPDLQISATFHTAGQVFDVHGWVYGTISANNIVMGDYSHRDGSTWYYIGGEHGAGAASAVRFPKRAPPHGFLNCYIFFWRAK